MRRRSALMGLAVLLVSPCAALAQPWDHREDHYDRREDRRDAREDLRDSLYDGGPADRIEDRIDRREDRRDHREDVRDRANREWWRGRPEFAAFVGPRPGYYFAPGYGYYRVPAPYYRRVWRVGVVLPPPLRHYRVVHPALFRLRPPPPGHAWIHVDNDILLISVATGVIVSAMLDAW